VLLGVIDSVGILVGVAVSTDNIDGVLLVEVGILGVAVAVTV